MAIKDALKKSDPVILEPVMAVEVETPEEYTGFVMGDIPSRRGIIQGQEQRGNAVCISAKVPLGQMFGYATDLRSWHSGSCDVHHAVRFVRACSQERSRRNYQQGWWQRLSLWRLSVHRHYGGNEVAKENIRIRLKGYDHEIVDQSTKLIVDTAQKTGAKVSGPIPLPTERNLYCVVKGPHVEQGLSRAVRNAHS